MDPITHTAAGVAIARLIPAPSRKWGLLAGAAFALLPDIDFLFILVDRLSYIRYHRGVTHSLLALGLFALLGAWAGRRLGGARWFRPLLALGVAVLGSHLLLDVATSYGTQILSPFSRHKFALDWLFIIDPYLTLMLFIGAAGAAFTRTRGRLLAAVSLSLAGGYFLLCGLYHTQALTLGQRLLTAKEPAVSRVAALPQPFSPRRWHLLAAGPNGVKQAMVQMPRLAFLEGPDPVNATEISWTPGLNPHAPPLMYQSPRQLVVHAWHGADAPAVTLSPDAAQILDQYLEFARFPLLFQAGRVGGDWVLTWLDLRFTVPGRAFPFVFELSLRPDGVLSGWQFGHGRFFKP
jgi:inner membrane protein